MHPTCDKSSVGTSINAIRSAMPAWKRIIDIALCVVTLPVLAVCTLIMALIMKIVSPGPVFFRQDRIGHMGRRFKIYKFRTMRVGADTTNHQAYFKEVVGTNAPMLKLDSKGDSRLIPGSWLLRASGLDELPQVINVLRGEMSVVGPRPCLPSEFELYQPWQRNRFLSVPGLTGLWQVSGKNRTTFDEMIHLDLRYVETKSILLDVKIIVMTVPALLIQIYETKLGRKSPAASAHTIAPFTMPKARVPANSR